VFDQSYGFVDSVKLKEAITRLEKQLPKEQAARLRAEDSAILHCSFFHNMNHVPNYDWSVFVIF